MITPNDPSPSMNSSHDTSKSLYGLLIVMTGVSVCLIGVKIYCSIRNGSSLNHVAGAWIAIAMDLRDGIFYRPLFSEPIGYGGTRFFPLFFSLHALMMRLLDMPILSGHIVSLFSGLCLLAGCFLFLRSMNVKPLIAAALTSLMLFSSSIQHGFQTIRGDILPLALNMFGFVVFFSKLPEKYREILTSACFVLAFSAKLTAINGIVSLCLWLFITGHKKQALRISLFTLIGGVLFLVILYYGTSGRIVSIFQACSSGGATVKSIIKSILRFFEVLVHMDMVCLLLLFWAAITFCHQDQKDYTLSSIFFGITSVMTVMLFGSPGVSFNHLVDITIASVLFVGASEFNNDSKSLRSSLYSYAVVVFFLLIMNLPMVNEEISNFKKGKTRYPKELIHLIQENHKVISEDPMLPIMANQSPYLLDPFMLRLIVLRNHAVKQSMIQSVLHKDFPALIFRKDPLTNVEYYSDTHFGYDFLKTAIENYKEGQVYKGYIVYYPKE